MRNWSSRTKVAIINGEKYTWKELVPASLIANTNRQFIENINLEENNMTEPVYEMPTADFSKDGDDPLRQVKVHLENKYGSTQAKEALRKMSGADVLLLIDNLKKGDQQTTNELNEMPEIDFSK